MTRYITIYTPNEEKRENYPVTRDSEISCTLMGDTFIKVVFNHPDIIDFKAGSFITHDRRKWSLLKSYKPESIANVDGYKYELKFYAEQHQLQRCRLFWTQGSTREVSFNLTTRLRDFAQLICDNINYFLSTTSYNLYTTWSVGDIPAHLSDKSLYQAFDGASCWDALTAIANAFEVEWWVEDHWGKRTATLHFGKCENGNAIEFAEGGIVSKMPASKRGDDSKYGTRFYVYGGTQNIPDDYYASQDGGVTNHVSAKRLHLPSGYSYIDSKSGLQPNEVIEQVVMLDNIFPINTETIDNVTTRTETKDGVETTYYKIVCVNSSFKPSDKLAESIGAKFLTGSLMGREYSLIYAADFLTTKTFEIVARNEGTGDTSIITPNQYLKPKAGDTFVLTGVKLPDERIKEAENKLLIAGQTIAQQHSADTEVYECPTDPVYCAQNNHNFQLGQRVTLVGAAFGDGRISRIQGYTKKLWNEYEATYSVGDNARYTRYGAISVIATNLKVETAKQVQSLKNNTGRVDAELKIIANSVGNADIANKVNVLIGDDAWMSAREIAKDATLANRIPYLKADAFAFLQPEDFTVEVAYDGSTWETLDNNNADMRGMFAQMNYGTGFPIDGDNNKKWKEKSKIRITLSPKAARNAKVDFVALNIFANGRTFDILTEYYDSSSGKEGWYSVGDPITISSNGISFVKYNQFFSFAGNARGGARFTFTITRNTNFGSRIVGLSGYSNQAAEIIPTSSAAPYTLGTLWYWDYLKNVYFPNNIYEGGKSLGEKYAGKSDVGALASVVQDKANTSYVDDFFVRKEEAIDFAKDLTGVLEATPEEFTFRPSAGDKSIRDESAVIRRIKGNTSVWGQYVRNGNFTEGTRYSTGVNATLSNNDDGSINIVNKGTESDGISQQFVSPIPAKHKVLIVMDYKRSSTAVSNVVFYLTKSGSGIYDRSFIYSVSSDSRRVDSAILETTNDTDIILVYPFIKGVAGEYVTMYSYMAIDLTAVFGAGKEPTTYEEFRKYYPDAYYPYCEPELRTMRATAIETVGFNLFNGEYADLIGGKTYYIGGTDIGTLTFTPNGTPASEVIELGDDRTYTPLVSGKIYSTGTDVCVHFQHSGIKDGECADYVEHMLELPEIAKYFPDGMNGIGKVYDEINAENAIQRCGVRAYEDGDENDPNVITDRTNTVYQLAEPIVKPIIEPIQLAYDVEDFGTERAISPEDSAPFRADIVYQFNAEGRIRDNGRNIDKLELQVNTLDEVTKSIASRFDGGMVIADGLVDGEGNPFWLPSTRRINKDKRLASEQFVIDNIPTEAATATPLQSFSYISEIGSMAPNVMYECAKGLGGTLSFELPPLNQPSSGYDHSWMIRFPSIENSNILTYPYPIKWKDGTPPTFVNSCTLEIYLKKTGAGEIIGEWKIYR